MAGMTYEQLIGGIFQAALDRHAATLQSRCCELTPIRNGAERIHTCRDGPGRKRATTVREPNLAYPPADPEAPSPGAVNLMIDDAFDAAPTRRPRFLILFNEPVLDAAHPDAESEHEILYTADAVHETLAKAGYDVARLSVRRDPLVLVAGLRRLQPDVVFNLFEGLADFGSTEAHVAGVLEWAGVPFTGSPYQTLSLARSKHLTKHLLAGAGLPTPAFFVVEETPGRAEPAGLAGHRQARHWRTPASASTRAASSPLSMT